MPTLNPNSLKIGYIILVVTPKPAIQALQRKAGYGESSKWAHVAGCLGGYTAIEADIPRSHLINLQKEYVGKGYEIKVMKRRNQEGGRRLPYSELIATGFHKEGDYLFGKPAENVLPADFDNPELFEEVKDIWEDFPTK